MKPLAKYWISLVLVLGLSAYQPYDYFTWFLEVFPVKISTSECAQISQYTSGVNRHLG